MFEDACEYVVKASQLIWEKFESREAAKSGAHSGLLIFFGWIDASGKFDANNHFKHIPVDVDDMATRHPSSLDCTSS